MIRGIDFHEDFRRRNFRDSSDTYQYIIYLYGVFHYDH